MVMPVKPTPKRNYKTKKWADAPAAQQSLACASAPNPGKRLPEKHTLATRRA
jgi:hypothetical protein